MGCDIHLYKEKFVDGQWVTADVWQKCDLDDSRMEVPYESTYNDRNYNLFGLLAGVRNDHEYSLVARGMPFDACELVSKASSDWDCDGHSHSYIYLHELKSLRNFLQTQTVKIEGMKDKASLEKFQESMQSGSPDYDLLYPYCGWTNQPNCVPFEVDLPASYIMGGGLDKIIKLFDGVDGDNHRIVFWFDN